jgi:lysylphosphatidylglycerol synthetase-like protein (DUF2156 family)
MLAKPPFPEIDQRTMKLIVGVIALTLPIATNYLASLDGSPLGSISESYWRGGWPQTILVGFLFAIASFLIAYNGQSNPEMLLSKAAAAAALGVAMFPCGCNNQAQIIPGVHYAAAGVMFGVLATFCYLFLTRALAKGHREAKIRAVIYAACGVAIAICILALGYNGATRGSLVAHFPDFVFWGEAGGLWAFGISWLTASHVLPGITTPGERFPLIAHGHAQHVAAGSLRPQ